MRRAALGAVAERIKFSAILLFVALWMLIVYFPLAHMVWGINGMMNGVWNAGASIKAIDFAGGTVVHMTSGWSALILCIILGKRIGFGKEHFAQKMLLELDAGVTAKEVLKEAEDEANRVENEMYVIARQLWAQTLPKKVLPVDDENGRRETIRLVLAETNKEHGKADEHEAADDEPERDGAGRAGSAHA